MTISCSPRSEAQLRRVVTLLKEAGFSEQYEEQAHGEHVLLFIHTRSPEQLEQVKEILHEAGIFDVIFRDETAA